MLNEAVAEQIYHAYSFTKHLKFDFINIILCDFNFLNLKTLFNCRTCVCLRKKIKV